MVNCRECEFHGFCTDPDSDESIGEQAEWMKQAADLIESLTAQLEEWQNQHRQAALNYQQKCRDVVELEAQLAASQQETRAFEAATRRHYNDMTSQCFICYSCINHNARLNWDRKSEYACSGCGKGKPKWQFDIARFSSQGNKEEANGNVRGLIRTNVSSGAERMLESNDTIWARTHA